MSFPGVHDARKAARMFIRAARMAGRKPPTNPMMTENASDQTMIEGEREKLNASSEKEEKFIIETEKN